MTELSALISALGNSASALLAAGEPAMDAATSFRVISRALHLVCAIILGGGVFYMRSVLSYAGPDACFAGRRQVWGRWVAIASTLLLATGLFNYITIVRAAKAPGAPELPLTYHMFFGLKFALAIGVMFIAAIVAGNSAAAEKARASIARYLNIAWTMVMAIVILGAMMRFLHP
jgi:putative copper export protein